jgi:glutamate synthase domain-containing protein 2
MLRFAVFGFVLALIVLTVLLAVTLLPLILWALVVLLPIAALGVRDIIQTEHSILRNYPILGHMRWAFEGIRPEIRQYFVESDEEAVPFSREQRSIVYQRAKNELDKRPFGTELDVYEDG